MRYLNATYTSATGALTLDSTDAGRASDHLTTTINFTGLPTGYIIKLIFDTTIEDTWTGASVVPSFYLSSGSMVLPNPVLRGAKNGKLGMQLHILSEDGTIVKTSDIAELDVSEGINDTRYDYIPDYLELMNWIKTHAVVSVERGTSVEGNPTIVFISESESFEIEILYTDIVGRLILGESSDTAYRGDRGKFAYDHTSRIDNPHGVTKAQVGLENADNTHDLDKPIPNAQAAINSVKADLIGGKVPSSQLPSYVDDTIESYVVGTTPLASDWLSLSDGGAPLTPESGKIYVILSSGEYVNRTYRWSGSTYVEISPSLVLGETPDTAYRGDRGKEAYDHSKTTGNPHSTYFSEIFNTPYIIDRKDGIVPWDSAVSYNSGAICRLGGVLYYSLINANLNHHPTDTDYWMPYNTAQTPTPQDTYATTIGDRITTDFVVTHNLNSLNVIASIYSLNGDKPTMSVITEHTNVNQMTFRFYTAPDTNSVAVIITRPGTSVSGVKVQDEATEYGVVTVTRNKLGLGTASTYDAGVSAGQVLVLNSSAQVPNSAIPSIAISEYRGASSTRADLVLKTDAEKGDWSYVTSDSNLLYRGSWILNGFDPTVLSDWIQFSGPQSVGIEFAGYTMCVDSSGDVVPVKKNHKATITGDGSTTRFTIDAGILDISGYTITDQNGFEVMTMITRSGTTSLILEFYTAPAVGEIYTLRVKG